jgi:hypothetical protein
VAVHRRANQRIDALRKAWHPRLSIAYPGGTIQASLVAGDALGLHDLLAREVVGAVGGAGHGGKGRREKEDCLTFAHGVLL